MRFGWFDVFAASVGLAFTILGAYAGSAALAFLGGIWLGAFSFKLGYAWDSQQPQAGQDAK